MEERRPKNFNLEGKIKVPQISQIKISPKVKESFTAYCENSTIQGVKYLVQESSTFEKSWWYIVVGLCIFGCILMSYQNWVNWKEKPILVSLATQDLGIWEIPFPATTICPETKITNTCLNYTVTLREYVNGKNLTGEEKQFFDYMSLTCKEENYKDLSQGPTFFDEDYFEFLNLCRSVDLEYSFCKWMGVNYDCKDLLKPVMTDVGLCYNFNMFDVPDIYTEEVVKHSFELDQNDTYAWDVDNGYDKDYFLYGTPKRAVEPGARNALMIALFTPKQDLINSCRPFVKQGMRVSLHMPNRIPRPSQVFFHIDLESLVSATILPSMSTTSEDVKGFDPEIRNCYFSKERQLRYFKSYSQNNCNMECVTNFTLDYCGCVAYYMPRTNDTPVCGLAKLDCLSEANDEFIIYTQNSTTEEEVAKRKCDCRPMCIDITYDVEISDDEWHWYEQVESRIADEDVLKALQDYQVSAVRIFFRDSYFLPRQKQELYETSDLISNFGGILGLFTGFSLFSLAEIIYFVAKPIILNIRRNSNRPT